MKEMIIIKKSKKELQPRNKFSEFILVSSLHLVPLYYLVAYISLLERKRDQHTNYAAHLLKNVN
jgi:hypothetical protein